MKGPTRRRRRVGEGKVDETQDESTTADYADMYPLVQLTAPPNVGRKAGSREVHHDNKLSPGELTSSGDD